MVRLVVVVLCLWGSLASARNVYVNGVKLEDSMVLKNQSFAQAEVRFDEKGDLWITAKGYKLQIADVDLTPPPTRPHWLVVRETRRGGSGYQLDVYLNDKLVKRVSSGEEQVLVDVTTKLRIGDNKVRIIARKLEKRDPGPPEDQMSVVVGEGQMKDGRLLIERPLLEYKRTAAESQGFADDYRFTTR
jgi:hypothetical protein